MRQHLSLTVWRDSVCAGDDCDAPHERAFAMPSEFTLGQTAAQLLGSSYLASISGGKATWFLEGKEKRPLLVFAQQSSELRFLVSADTAISDCIQLRDTPHLRFRYWCQVDPDRVFDCLKDGKPLPDRYGR
jgi:hypothetical protein